MKNCRPAQTSGRDRSGHHLYVLRIDFKQIALTRGQVMKKLKEYGVGSQVHYIPVPSQPYYRQLGFKPEDYSNAQLFYEQALSIPLFFDLSDDQQNQVIQAIKEVVE
jgi:dTDP-4-amino-4,6-dideoxygalactose transaminase